MSFFENLISGTFPFVFLMVCGIYLSIKTKFCQITRFFESLKLTVKAFFEKEKSDRVTSFKAACTALSATVGTGNIAGVAGAVSIGGAGAIFWLWVSGALGMCIKAAEITLATLYRQRNNGEFAGGPMYYIKNGLSKAFAPLGILFCLASIPAVICSGNITQTNAAIMSVSGNQGIRLLFGIVFSVGCFLSVRGGIKRIASITEKIVPLMSVLYIALSLFVIFSNAQALPHCFEMIFKGAFNPKAVTGGAVGSVTTCIYIGCSRGIFSNEAGLGTSAMAHSVAVDADPRVQGLLGIFEVFVDTILLCTLTGLTILCSGVKINYGTVASTELVSRLLFKEMGVFGVIALGIMMCLFAFSSIIGWAVYGNLIVGFIFGEKGNKIFKAVYPVCCILGAVLGSSFAWRLAGICNGIMLCINLTVVLLLSGEAVKYLKRGYKIDRRKNKSGKENFKSATRGTDYNRR